MKSNGLRKFVLRSVGLTIVLVMVAAACSSEDNTAMYVEATIQAQALATLQAEATVAAENASKAIEEATDTQAKLAEELPPTPEPSATPEPSPTPPPTPYVRSAQEILVENVSTAIVFIETPMGIGTGFVVSDSGLIITAAHVIEGYDTVTIRPNRSNFTGDAQVIYANYETDLAILASPLNTPNFLNIEESSQIGSGHEVIAIGYPAAELLEDPEPSVSRGIISRPINEDGISFFEHDARILSGNSGGPLMSVTTGNVLGLNFLAYTDDIVGDALYYAVSHVEIRNALMGSNAIKLVDSRYVVVPTPTPAPTATPAPTPTPRPTPTAAPTAVPTSTPRAAPTSTPRPTATATPLPKESSFSEACDESPLFGSIPIYYSYPIGADGPTDITRSQAAVYEVENKLTGEGIPKFPPNSILPNGTFSAEFKVDTTGNASFGFVFRKHDDERVVLNNGKAVDRIFVRYIKGSYADTITWTHQVRNRFITSLDWDQTTIKSGTIPLNQFNVGPRGWNKLTVQINDNQAWIYFNDVYLTELAIETVDSSKTYKNYWESGIMSNDPINSVTYMRYPTVACIE